MYLIVKRHGIVEQRRDLDNLRWWLDAVQGNILQVIRFKDGQFEELFAKDEPIPGGKCIRRVEDWRSVTVSWR